jgi:CubicO group peptidase (beta-lactamase class C family)
MTGLERVAELIAADPDGAACCVVVDGEPVLDVWSGTSDGATPWSRATLCPGLSTAKALLALAAAMLADRGLLDVDAPVHRYWPEFAAGGKRAITVRMVLTHRSGLPWFEARDVVSTDRPESFRDRERIVAAIARSRPVLPPGELAYGSLTMGWIVDELFRRIAGTGVRDFVRREIAAPLGARLYLGLPGDVHDPVAELVPDARFDDDDVAAAVNPRTPAGRCLFAGERRLGDVVRGTWNDDAFRAAEIPSLGLYADARSLALVHGLLAAGDERLVSHETLARFATPSVSGVDACWGATWTFGTGFVCGRGSGYWFGPSRGTFGHHGISGATVFADPHLRLGFAYLPRRAAYTAGVDSRVRALIAETCGALGGAPEPELASAGASDGNRPRWGLT